MLLKAWITYTLLPMVEGIVDGAIKQRIPLNQIAGAFAAAAVRVAIKASMTKAELQSIVDDSWSRQAPPTTPPPAPPGG